MNRIACLLLLLMMGFNAPHQNDLTALRGEVIRDIINTTVDEKQMMDLLSLMRPDGSWPDIDYTDKTRGAWTVNNHLVRLYQLSVMHYREQSKYHNDLLLRKKIIAGLNYWFKNDFICPNWWYPEIGVPKTLAPAMILMQPFLSEAEIASGVKILDRSKIGMTGQNKVWLAGNVIYRSLITNDEQQVNQAVQAIQSEITISEGEGIQRDFSFHQHGPQQQFGNYGLSFAGDMLKWGSIFQSTRFRFDPAKVEMLRQYLLNGLKWVVWKKKMDISACGRQLFGNAQTGKAESAINTIRNMHLIDPEYTSQYQQALTDFSGDKHFWRSDMTVHRRSHFYCSLKMCSSRVAGAESCNEENVSGYHLADGATYFYRSNEEYTDIFPYWDWKMIPGTTTFHDEGKLPVLGCDGYRIKSDFVGGVSDGMNGAAAMTYNRDSLFARKAWFFLDDITVCLGNGIESVLTKPIRTTINQAFLQGNLLVKQNNKTFSPPPGEHKLEACSWVMQDNWAYYFPKNSDVVLKNNLQEGDWHEVVRRIPSKKIQANIFSLWFDHQIGAKDYAYYVMPSSSPKQLEAKAKKVRIIGNSASLQAVESPAINTAAFIFTKAGSAKASFLPEISTNTPCIVLANTGKNGLSISISEPTHHVRQMIISIAGRRSSPTHTGSFHPRRDQTDFDIQLPESGDAGKTVTLIIK